MIETINLINHRNRKRVPKVKLLYAFFYTTQLLNFYVIALEFLISI